VVLATHVMYVYVYACVGLWKGSGLLDRVMENRVSHGPARERRSRLANRCDRFDWVGETSGDQRSGFRRLGWIFLYPYPFLKLAGTVAGSDGGPLPKQTARSNPNGPKVVVSEGA